MGMKWHVWISMFRPDTASGQPARIRLLLATTRISTKFVIRSIPIRYTVGLAVRIFPATTRTFTKDTALSENGRGAAWHVWFNAAQHGSGTAWQWHGMTVARHGSGTVWQWHGMAVARHGSGTAWQWHGMGAARYVWINLKDNNPTSVATAPV
jgi:hypothetical protein